MTPTLKFPSMTVTHALERLEAKAHMLRIRGASIRFWMPGAGSVCCRKRDGETLAQMICRAAVEIDTPSKNRTPQRQPLQRCVCGATTSLAWNRKMKEFLCRECRNGITNRRPDAPKATT